MADVVDLCGWYSEEREDNFATSDPAWMPYALEGWRREPDYFFVRHEGYLFAPENPQEGTIPLHQWWMSKPREDSFTTTNPAWAGGPGDTRSPGYEYVRLAGHVVHPDKTNIPPKVASYLLPLYSWWDPYRNDNFITSLSEWAGAPGEHRSPNYEFVRLEGYAFWWHDDWPIPG